MDSMTEPTPNVDPLNENRLYSAAIKYVRLGWRVIPLLPRSKKPCIRWKSFQTIAPTETQVREWWTKWPDANVGLITGVGTDLVVVDTDNQAAEEALQGIMGDPAVTPTSRTAKGRHRLFRQTEPPLRSSVRVQPGVDVRGEGGYIVAPPSVHPSGHVYAWELGPETSLAPLPNSLLEFVSQRDEPRQAVDVSERPRIGGPKNLLEALHCEGVGPLWMNICPAHEDSTPSLSVKELSNGNVLLKCHAGCATDAVLRAIRAHSSDLFASKELREAIPEERRAAFRFLSIEDLLTLEPTPWLVEGLLPSRALAFVYALPATYKSFFCIDLALCVAAGLPWHGRGVEQGPVVYVAAEGNAPEIAARVKAWSEHYGSTVTAQFHCLTRSLDLSNATCIDDFLASLPEPPRLVVIDTLARCTSGLDENKSTDMGRAVALIDRIREHTGATVVLVHHTRKNDSEMRGSGALEAAADTCISLARTKTGRIVRVECGKQKDAPEFTEFTLELREQGASAVLVEVIPDVRGASNEERLTPNDGKALRSLSPEGMRHNSWKLASGLSGSSFDESRKRLLASGAVIQIKGFYRPTAANLDVTEESLGS
jgi:hypothetical protein